MPQSENQDHAPTQFPTFKKWGVSTKNFMQNNAVRLTAILLVVFGLVFAAITIWDLSRLVLRGGFGYILMSLLFLQHIFLTFITASCLVIFGGLKMVKAGILVAQGQRRGIPIGTKAVAIVFFSGLFIAFYYTLYGKWSWGLTLALTSFVLVNVLILFMLRFSKRILKIDKKDGVET